MYVIFVGLGKMVRKERSRLKKYLTCIHSPGGSYGSFLCYFWLALCFSHFFPSFIRPKRTNKQKHHTSIHTSPRLRDTLLLFNIYKLKKRPFHFPYLPPLTGWLHRERLPRHSPFLFLIFDIKRRRIHLKVSPRRDSKQVRDPERLFLFM